MCLRCRETLPYEMFYTRPSQKTGYGTTCRLCLNNLQQQRRASKKAKGLSENRHSVASRKARLKKRIYILEYLKTHPCIDCGENHLAVLDFDHVRGVKSESVTVMLSHAYSQKRIDEEIAKCEVRCANCHRKRTASTQRWARMEYKTLTLL